ncbi:MAG: outer membrane protein assembly factor BamE [Desulfovibrionaceae bacterium]|nr:outer membrane protein assembly factor BamE [Desulfovibrionaceae bacterium]
MSKNYGIISIAVLTMLICACSALDYKTGIYVSQEQMEKFENGKTKQADIIAALGHPNSKSQMNNVEVWYYDYTKIAALPFAGNINESSVFEFNAKGILMNHYKTNQRNTQTGNPLLDSQKLKN